MIVRVVRIAHYVYGKVLTKRKVQGCACVCACACVHVHAPRISKTFRDPPTCSTDVICPLGSSGVPSELLPFSVER